MSREKLKLNQLRYLFPSLKIECLLDRNKKEGIIKRGKKIIFRGTIEKTEEEYRRLIKQDLPAKEKKGRKSPTYPICREPLKEKLAKKYFATRRGERR